MPSAIEIQEAQNGLFSPNKRKSRQIRVLQFSAVLYILYLLITVWNVGLSRPERIGNQNVS